MVKKTTIDPSLGDRKFLREIESIMWAMGDCRRPLVQSAQMIEDVMSRSVRLVMSEAQSVAESRDEQWLGVEDLLFTLRKDRPLLLRLIRYMRIRDLRSNTLGDGDPEEIEILDEPESCGKISSTSSSRSRIQSVQRFLEKFDADGSLLDLLNDHSTDLIKHERARRAELQVRHMETSEYLRYTEARQVSLFKVFPRRLRDHFCVGKFVDFKPSPMVMEILAFCAQETIAIIMDSVHTIRRETNFAKRNSSAPLVMRSKSVTLETRFSPLIAASKGKDIGGSLLGKPIQPKRNSEDQQVINDSSVPVGIDVSQNSAIKPDEISEAVRRLIQYRRLTSGPSKLFSESDSLRII